MDILAVYYNKCIHLWHSEMFNTLLVENTQHITCLIKQHSFLLKTTRILKSSLLSPEQNWNVILHMTLAKLQPWAVNTRNVRTGLSDWNVKHSCTK